MAYRRATRDERRHSQTHVALLPSAKSDLTRSSSPTHSRDNAGSPSPCPPTAREAEPTHGASESSASHCQQASAHAPGTTAPSPTTADADTTGPTRTASPRRPDDPFATLRPSG